MHDRAMRGERIDLRETDAPTDDRSTIVFAIVARAGDRRIGTITLGPIRWIHRFGDIGVRIDDDDLWNEGHAAEAIRLVAEYGFRELDLHKVGAACHGDDERAVRTFQKAGFTLEGRRGAQFYANGTYVDEVLLGLIR